MKLGCRLTYQKQKGLGLGMKVWEAGGKSVWLKDWCFMAAKYIQQCFELKFDP